MTVFFFWAVVGALLFLGVGAVAAALMGKTPFQTARDSTLTVLSDDYAEIDRDREAGLLSEKDGEAAKDDVRRATLQREAAEHKPSTVKPSVGVALGAAVAVTVLSLSLYAWFGEPGLVEVFAAEPEGGLMKTDGTLGVNARSISPEAFRLYLKKRPDDERAWVLYARECADVGNWQGAHDAYKAAVALNRFVAEDADVLMQYAAVTYNLKTSKATDEAIAILGRAEALDEKNLKVKEMLAMFALQARRWTAARTALEGLLVLMPADEPARASVAQAAAYAAEAERRENNR